MLLLWRVFLTNAAVLTAATLALAITPATVSFPVALTELIVLAAGLSALLVLNLVLLRRAFAPLERLTRFMRAVDPLRPGSRAPVEGSTGEIAELTLAFNEMIERVEGERRESGRRALAAQEAERRRVSRELHDEVGQSLTAVILELESAVRGSEGRETIALESAREGLRETLVEVREIARRLRPEALDELGLPSALRGLAAGVERGAGLKVERDIEAPLPRLDQDEELVVYRVAQEALTNVARHASARTVRLALRSEEAGLVLCVRDDGHGFDSASTTEGDGVRGMRERAVLVGAAVKIESSPGAGTEVRLTLAGSQRE
jgi:two-component system, NarL family, sensor histidine kinase UhpB